MNAKGDPLGPQPPMGKIINEIMPSIDMYIIYTYVHMYIHVFTMKEYMYICSCIYIYIYVWQRLINPVTEHLMKTVTILPRVTQGSHA